MRSFFIGIAVVAAFWTLAPAWGWDNILYGDCPADQWAVGTYDPLTDEPDPDEPDSDKPKPCLPGVTNDELVAWQAAMDEESGRWDSTLEAKPRAELIDEIEPMYKRSDWPTVKKITKGGWVIPTWGTVGVTHPRDAVARSPDDSDEQYARAARPWAYETSPAHPLTDTRAWVHTVWQLGWVDHVALSLSNRVTDAQMGMVELASQLGGYFVDLDQPICQRSGNAWVGFRDVDNARRRWANEGTASPPIRGDRNTIPNDVWAEAIDYPGFILQAEGTYRLDRRGDKYWVTVGAVLQSVHSSLQEYCEGLPAARYGPNGDLFGAQLDQAYFGGDGTLGQGYQRLFVSYCPYPMGITLAEIRIEKGNPLWGNAWYGWRGDENSPDNSVFAPVERKWVKLQRLGDSGNKLTDYRTVCDKWWLERVKYGPGSNFFVPPDPVPVGVSLPWLSWPRTIEINGRSVPSWSTATGSPRFHGLAPGVFQVTGSQPLAANGWLTGPVGGSVRVDSAGVATPRGTNDAWLSGMEKLKKYWKRNGEPGWANRTVGRWMVFGCALDQDYAMLPRQEGGAYSPGRLAGVRSQVAYSTQWLWSPYGVVGMSAPSVPTLDASGAEPLFGRLQTCVELSADGFSYPGGWERAFSSCKVPVRSGRINRWRDNAHACVQPQS